MTKQQTNFELKKTQFQAKITSRNSCFSSGRLILNNSKTCWQYNSVWCLGDTTLLFHVAAAGGKYRAADVGSTSCQQLRNPAAANFWQQLADVLLVWYCNSPPEPYSSYYSLSPTVMILFFLRSCLWNTKYNELLVFTEFSESVYHVYPAERPLSAPHSERRILHPHTWSRQCRLVSGSSNVNSRLMFRSIEAIDVSGKTTFLEAAKMKLVPNHQGANLQKITTTVCRNSFNFCTPYSW